MMRVGLIGAGFVGRNHFNQYEKLTDRVVVTLCDKEADRRAGDWSKIGGNIADARGTRRNLGDIKTCSEWRDLIADAQVDMVDLLPNERYTSPLKQGLAIVISRQKSSDSACE